MNTNGSTAPPMWTIVTDAGAIGFLINRGKLGWEAVDRDGNSLGIFETQQQADDAVYAGHRLSDDVRS
jgi:hypothetical protein